MLTRRQKDFNNDFEFINLKLASPEKILEWSRGEVTKPETINYRTQRSEKNGLFDEKIFGPDKDYECYCGKYRGIRYKGIVCEKCGVEITRSIVRRERMGHIELATPVAHIWFLRSVPSRIALVLGMNAGDLEKVVYFAGYIVTKVFESERGRILKDLDSEFKAKSKNLSDDKGRESLKELFLKAKKDIESLKEGIVLDEVAYHAYSLKYGTLFEAEIGAEAIYNMCKGLDLKQLVKNLEGEFEESSSVEKEKINKRLSVVRSMINSGIRSEWMFLTQIPVIPPALRPMVPLDGGRYATSDVNDLYRRVINRNNRLKKLKDINAPEVILRNEKRILQEAVDSLIDNSIRHGSASQGAFSQAQRRPLKSLSDNLKGKRGLFRQNLLGKRVDYSGRSVIVVGPDLRLNQCGLPKHMALELFKPFVISGLLKKELAYNIRGASRLIEEGIPEVWAILEEVIADKYVLLNRAPTLHRLGIQAFKPTLIEGNAIQIHPLVCTAFNADFDGDQMAVHVPLSDESQIEARSIMASDKNILKPGNGEPIVTAKLDIVLGAYWLTKIVAGIKGEGKMYSTPHEAVTTLDFGGVDIRAKITVLGSDEKKYSEFGGKTFETSVGRLIFNNVLPADYPYVNQEITRKRMAVLVDDLIDRYGYDNVPEILDNIKELGFEYATKSGTTWGIDDITEPVDKNKIVAEARIKNREVIEQYESGLLSPDERIRKNVEIWHDAKSMVEKLIPATLNPNGPVADMVFSGARGSLSQITQMAGMKGLIANIAGETIEFPIISSNKAGLTPIEYFITTHGSRKGLTDTALNTAKAGYLTRKLFVVAQDVIVQEEDCGTKNGVSIGKDSSSGIEIPMSRNIRGRMLSADVADKDGKILYKKGHLLSKHDARAIESLGIEKVTVRSPMTCESVHGVCVKCYGYDLGKNELVGLGEAVGTVAAQAIGEPGTQLTMRTFHAGGTAQVGGDITQGLPRVEEVFEKRAPKNPAAIAHSDGVVMDIKDNGKEKIIVVLSDAKDKRKKGSETEYNVHWRRMPLIKVGDKITKGDFLTDGSADIDELFKHSGREKTQQYIITEVNRLYELQGEAVSRKHIEVIVRQMFSKRRVKDPGDTVFSARDVVSDLELSRENNRVTKLGKDPAKAEQIVMGITEVSLSRRSFLSSASFQNSTRMLINAAIRGSKDHLVGLMENVIIGRLIPAGTGMESGRKHKMLMELSFPSQMSVDSADSTQ